MKPSVLSYGVSAVLAADITATATSLAVESGGSAFPALDFQVQIGHEIFFVASRSGNNFLGLTRGAEGTTAEPHNHGDSVVEVVGPQAVADRVEVTDRYAGAGESHQSIWADLDLEDNPAAGTSDAGDTAFIAAGMFNLLGAALTKTKNYLAGVIGAYSVTGAKAGELPAAALLGIAMDGVTDIDGIVVAHIDGSDPSAETRVGAMFKASIANNDADSGADYGLDLYNAGVSSAILTGSGIPLAYEKADVRLSHELIVLSTASTPVDYTDGTPPATGEGYAAKGSLCVARDTGKLYSNTGTKAEPIWTLVGAQS